MYSFFARVRGYLDRALDLLAQADLFIARVRKAAVAAATSTATVIAAISAGADLLTVIGLVVAGIATVAGVYQARNQGA